MTGDPVTKFSEKRQIFICNFNVMRRDENRRGDTNANFFLLFNQRFFFQF